MDGADADGMFSDAKICKKPDKEAVDVLLIFNKNQQSRKALTVRDLYRLRLFYLRYDIVEFFGLPVNAE